MTKICTTEDVNLHYLSGFNDALMLIQLAHEKKSWDKAMNEFDFSERDIMCPITEKNIDKVRKIIKA